MSECDQTRAATEIRIAAVVAEEQTRRIDAAIARRAYEIFEERGGMGWHELEDWRKAEAELDCRSCVGLTSSETAVLVGCNTAGFAEGSIEIWVAPRQMTICGTPIQKDRTSQGARPYSGPVFRVLKLPVEIDPCRVFATVRQGCFLEIHLPVGAQKKLVQLQAA